MKRYNKPVVEIKGFEVEDIITTSIYATGYSNANELQAVYNDFVGGNTSENDRLAIFEW